MVEKNGEKKNMQKKEQFRLYNDTFLPWKLNPNMWKSFDGIYALKTRGKKGWGIPAHNDNISQL